MKGFDLRLLLLVPVLVAIALVLQPLGWSYDAVDVVAVQNVAWKDNQCVIDLVTISGLTKVYSPTCSIAIMTFANGLPVNIPGYRSDFSFKYHVASRVSDQGYGRGVEPAVTGNLTWNMLLNCADPGPYNCNGVAWGCNAQWKSPRPVGCYLTPEASNYNLVGSCGDTIGTPQYPACSDCAGLCTMSSYYINQREITLHSVPLDIGYTNSIVNAPYPTKFSLSLKFNTDWVKANTPLTPTTTTIKVVQQTTSTTSTLPPVTTTGASPTTTISSTTTTVPSSQKETNTTAWAIIGVSVVAIAWGLMRR
jgi:hypothetical protein